MQHRHVTAAFISQSIPENGTPEATPVVTSTQPSPAQAAPGVPTQNASPPVRPSEPPGSLSAAQEEKLRKEMALVKGNLTVMSEMLNELIPGQSQPDETELLQVCVCVCVLERPLSLCVCSCLFNCVCILDLCAFEMPESGVNVSSYLIFC